MADDRAADRRAGRATVALQDAVVPRQPGAGQVPDAHERGAGRRDRGQGEPALPGRTDAPGGEAIEQFGWCHRGDGQPECAALAPAAGGAGAWERAGRRGRRCRCRSPMSPAVERGRRDCRLTTKGARDALLSMQKTYGAAKAASRSSTPASTPGHRAEGMEKRHDRTPRRPAPCPPPDPIPEPGGPLMPDESHNHLKAIQKASYADLTDEQRTQAQWQPGLCETRGGHVVERPRVWPPRLRSQSSAGRTTGARAARCAGPT